MSDQSVVIIGSGLGGLLTGAFLSKNGKRVTVVEKNDQIGGSLQCYRRAGAAFDTGMHVFGGMGKDGNISRICNYLGIRDKIEVHELDKINPVEVYVGSDRSIYHVTYHGESFVECLSNYFPKERDNLKRYFKAISDVMDDLDLFHLRTDRRDFSMSADASLAANRFIERYVSSPRLRALLSVVSLLYAGERDISPSFLHAAISMVFFNGSARIAGGYSIFADALRDCIEENGGRVLTGVNIDKIHCEKGAVDYVCSSSGEVFPGDIFISDISPIALLDMEETGHLFSKAFQTYLRRRKDSLSAFIVNIKVRPDSVPYSNRVGFYLRDNDSAWKCYGNNSVEKFMYSTPPVKRQGKYAETFNITMPMSWNMVEKWTPTSVHQRGEEYRIFKDKITREVLETMSLIYPELTNNIEYVDSASPLTIRDYLGISQGAMCGLRQDCRETLNVLPIRTRVSNLFLTGQNVNMHGFCGVAMTALETAEAILGKDVIVSQL